MNQPIRPAVPGEFVECDVDNAKPGSPYLCSGCLHNRQVIADLKKSLERAKAELISWQAWTQGHVWIRNEEYRDLSALKLEHGRKPPGL